MAYVNLWLIKQKAYINWYKSVKDTLPAALKSIMTANIWKSSMGLSSSTIGKLFHNWLSWQQNINFDCVCVRMAAKTK